MWGVIFLIVFFMFFRRTSGFAVGQTSVFDLAEFNSFPSDMKASLKIGINGVMDALGKRISYEWNSYTPQEKSKLLAKYKNGFSQYIAALKAVPLNKDELDPQSYNKRPPPPMMAAAPAPMMAPPPPMMAAPVGFHY
jgi:hypothetical protein